MPESQARRPDAQLARQAEVLRKNSAGSLRSRTQYTALQRVFVTLVLLLSTSGAMFLALSGSGRQVFLSRLGEEWARLYETDVSQGIFSLPAPPPKRMEPRVVLGSAPIPVFQQEGDVYTTGVDQSGQESLEKTFVPPQVTPGFEAAFKLLSVESPAASKLLAGELSGYRYKEWKPLQNRHPEYYVSLLAERISDQTEVQFVWSVNTENSRITPLSQAARDLERTP